MSTTELPRAMTVGLAPTPMAFVDALLSARRRLVLLGVVGALVVGSAVIARPRQFTAEATFTPQSRRAQTAFAGLAAQFGVTLPSAEASESPAFFLALLRSRPILDSVLLAGHAPEGQGPPASLVDLLGVRSRDADGRLALAEKKLLARVTSYVDPKTGIITLRVTMPSRRLAAEVAAQFLQRLDEFNRTSRRSQARAEREFTQHRLEEVRGELRDAEDRLQRFLQGNRGFRSSSELAFEEDRLRRDVAVRQEVYRTLTQAFEQARIEEVRDTPVITIVQRPDPPLEPDARGLVAKACLGGVLGAFLGAIGVLLASVWQEFRRREPEAAERLAGGVRDAWADLRRPWRLLKRSG